MALNIPETAAEVDDRAKADVQRELAQSNPFLKNSWLGALVTAYSNRIFDFYIQLNIAIRENFPDTATGSFLIRWAAIWGKQAIPATQSNGNVVATGVASSSIPDSTILTVADVGEFITTSLATISSQNLSILDLTRSGTTATALFPTDHDLASGVTVSVVNASNTEYNVTGPITVVSATSFEYQITGTPPDELGTSAFSQFTTASVPVMSVDFGADFNLDAGTQLTLQSPLAGVDDILTVDFGAIGGGTDDESDDSLRARMLDRIQNPVAHYNAADITEKAKEVAGVTRVWVQKVTPSLGEVTIYFMRDNDSNPIPSGSEVTTVKNKILEITPANTGDAQVFVFAPTGVSVDFTFTALDPSTASMQSSITANLQQLFDERTEVGVDIEEDAYRSTIFNTVDTETGALVSSFTLSVPSGDITIASGEIGTLGAVVYP